MKHYWKIDRVRNITPSNVIDYINFLETYEGQQYSVLTAAANTYYHKPAGAPYFGQIVTMMNILGLYEINDNGTYSLSESAKYISNNESRVKSYLEYFLLKFQFPRPHLADNQPFSKPYLIILKLLIELYKINPIQAYISKAEFYFLFNESVGTVDINTITSAFASNMVAGGRSQPAQPANSNDLTYDKNLLSNSPLLTTNESSFPAAVDFYIGLKPGKDNFTFANFQINHYASPFTFNLFASGSALQKIKNKWSKYTGNKKDFFEYLNEKNMLHHIEAFNHYCISKGFYFDNDLVRRFLSSLTAKPFLLLTGISGTGKSKIAELFGEFLGINNHGSFLMMAVGSNWNDQRALLGYCNPLIGPAPGQYFETSVVRFIREANSQQDKTFVLLLDEMNLSYTERYFADFLSALESRTNEITLPDQNRIKWSKNLKVVGTINEDETTHTLSPKVIDRSNIIEMNGVGPKVYLEDLIRRSDTKVTSLITKPWQQDFIELFEKVYVATNGRFGYRIIDEIVSYVVLNFDLTNADYKLYFDEQIYQKILPKIHGTRGEIKDTVNHIYQLCDSEGFSRSRQKAGNMLAQLTATGFTSFVTA